MATYLKATGRAALADLANRHAELLRADPEVEARSRDASSTRSSRSISRTLEPHVVGPHTPDLARPVSRMAARRARERLPGCALLGADRQLHQLLLRGSRARRRRRAPGAARTARARRRRSGSRRAPSRSTRRSSATASWRDFEAIGGDGARQRLRPLHRPVEARRRGRGRGELDHHLLQPQLPQAQRRQRGHLLVHREPGDRGRLRARRHARVQPAARRARGAAASASGWRRRRRRPSSRAAASSRARAGYEAPPDGRRARRGAGRAEQRAPAAARAVRALGRQGLRARCRSC